MRIPCRASRRRECCPNLKLNPTPTPNPNPNPNPNQGLTAEEVLRGVRMVPEDVAALAACLPGITALLAAVWA